MKNPTGLLLVICFVIVVGGLSIWWNYSRSSWLLEQWARRHGYRILSQEYCHFFRGPFFWTSGKGQVVYYVTLEDEEGRQRTCWVRCGGYFLGLLSDNVDVRWER